MSKKSPIDELPEPYRADARNSIAGAACDGWVADENIVAEATMKWTTSDGPEKAAEANARALERLKALGLSGTEYGEEHLDVFQQEFEKAFPRKRWPQ